MRRSILGPVVLILAGIAFLVHNLRPDLPVLTILSQYWPWFLVAWGLIRIGEISMAAANGAPMPRAGLSGGEWTLVVVLTLFGSAANSVRTGLDTGFLRISREAFSESFDFPVEDRKVVAGKTPRVVIENLRGNARVVGSDTEEIRVSGRTTVKALERVEAERASGEAPIEVESKDGLVVIRTNQAKVTGSLRVSTDLDIVVPRGASIEARGRYGDFDISSVQGSVTIDSDNTGARVSDIGGNVRIEARRSDIVRAVDVLGTVDVKGSGASVELENVAGACTIGGSFRELTLRRLAKGVQFESSSTELRVGAVPGHAYVTPSEMSAAGLKGPLVLSAKTKDVELSDFTDTVEIRVDRGDIELRPGTLQIAKMNARTRSGDVMVSLPEGAKFQVKGETRRGEVQHEYEGAIRASEVGRGHIVEGLVGAGGPLLSLVTDRGEISVMKSGLVPPEPPKPPAPPEAPLKVEEE